MVEKLGTKTDHLKKIYGDWALITGASSGIGKEFAFYLAKRGLNLVLIARRKDLLKKIQDVLITNFRVEVKVLVLDLCEESAIQQIRACIDPLEIGMLINNAGFANTGSFLENSLVDEIRLVKLNNLVPLQLTHIVGNHMKMRNRGAIINISSASGFLPMPGWANYAATKAYLISWSAALWEELKLYTIDTITICPSATKTEFALIAGVKHAGIQPLKVVETTFKYLGKEPYVFVGRNAKIGMAILNFFPKKLKILFGKKAVQSMKIRA